MPVFLSERKKKNLSVDIHPASREAYEFYHSLQLIFDKTQLGAASIDSLAKTQVYRATYLSDDQIGIVSGFEQIGFSIEHFCLKDALVLIETDLSFEQISEFSWGCVLRIILSSIGAQNLESIREALNLRAPHPLMHSIFRSDHITQKTLSRITNLSVSGLKKQKKRTKKEPTSIRTKPAIFSKMREVFNDE
ncbi:hypothetical protein [Vibrio cortegadensis]|uniref:Uncharacterized protein n=1 Tax=Vibrio cortegadensis TaxID=1328770 RepID=A0ABV4MAQ9_9VIBR|nr:hypothetical protein DS893_01230 [Vibrionales bacterium C3R12]